METAFEKLIETGILGAICVILMVVVGKLFKALMEEKDKRINEAETTTNHVTLTIENVNETLKAILVAIENGVKKEK